MCADENECVDDLPLANDDILVVELPKNKEFVFKLQKKQEEDIEEESTAADDSSMIEGSDSSSII